jgi:hypothetical protein
VAGFDAQRSGLGLFFDVPLGAGRYRLAGEAAASPECRHPRFTLSIVTASGGILSRERFTPAAADGAFALPVTLKDAGSRFLTLDLNVDAPAAGVCGVALRHLRMERL